MKRPPWDRDPAADIDRCPGSGQLVAEWSERRSLCPVCRTPQEVLVTDHPLLVDHRPRRDDALPLALGLFA